MRPEDFKPDDLFTQIQNLADKLAEERHARQMADADGKVKSELLATTGQELKGPVESLIAITELLSASPLDPAQCRYTQMLAESAWSLLGVVSELLDFTRLDDGRFELNPAEFDVHELLHDVGLALQDRAGEKGLTCGLDIGASCPRKAVADETRIRQVLMCLIDNALKLTSQGSVRLHASAIDLNGMWMLRFDVSDTGRGHTRAEREQLFKPVVKVPTAAQPGATGLELSIAQKLAALMGGEIGCDSVVGKGSLYWFTLAAEHAESEPVMVLHEPLPTMPAQEPLPLPAPRPATPKQKAPPALAVSVPEREPTAKLSGRVLVVEDNAVNAMLIANYLDEFGVNHELVGSARTALLNLTAKPYDLVLMDVTMPDLDGVEATQRVRALPGPAAEVPIIALVAHAKTAECGAYLAAGMDGYVTKPIRGRELYAALAPFLAQDEGDEPVLLVG
jgi:CheY-like chemotaxis protein/nitrogen-specific signal transduction histidine kinase